MLKIHVVDAGHGDCILLDFSHTKILIDGGPKQFKIRNNVIKTLEEILGLEKKIDIAVVTHNDDDHIGGFKYLLESGVKIEKFIFNSLKDIPDIIKFKQDQISYSQDNILIQKVLREKGIEVDTLTVDSEPFYVGDIRITAITPTINALASMLEDYNSKTTERGEKELKLPQIFKIKHQELSLIDCFQKIKSGQDKFVKDTSKPNKTSIGLVLEYFSFRGLFLGDAHEEDIIAGLILKGFQNKKFNIVKLSHHGSEKNTSTELLKLIGEAEYLICANKSKNNHPNNITIARILNFNNSAVIHFSSEKSTIMELLTDMDMVSKNIQCTNSKSNLNTICYECK